MKIKKCVKCKIAECRKNRVFGKGPIPADILVIGDAPDKSEDLMGVPLIGQVGVLLDRLIRDASHRLGMERTPSYYITYMIQCRPYILDKDDPDYFSDREPEKEEILNCMENILNLSKRVKPQIVVFIGKTPEKYYAKEFFLTTRILNLHYLVMQGGTKSPNYLGTIRTLMESFKELQVFHA